MVFKETQEEEVMSPIEAAIAMREAIGKSKAWTVGYLIAGDDDGVVSACRAFDAALDGGAGMGE